MLSLVDEERLRRILAIMLDEEEFLGPHGIRAISRRHLDAAVRVRLGRPAATRSHYLPAESDTGMFGGNSNWRGPVWFPMNLVILRGLCQLHRYYGDRLKVECPTGLRARDEPARGRDGDRAAADHARSPRTRTGVGRCSAASRSSRRDPHWHDLLLFHEYFHGDNGAGIGASHQTGWTGTVALLFLLPDAMRAQSGATAGVAG